MTDPQTDQQQQTAPEVKPKQKYTVDPNNKPGPTPEITQRDKLGRFITPWCGFKKCLDCGVGYFAKSTQRRFCDICIEKKTKCLNCGARRSIYHKFCSNTCATIYNSKNLVGGFSTRGSRISFSLKGKPKPFYYGDKNPNWRGGKNKNKRHVDMSRIEYKTWRRKVLAKEGKHCFLCSAETGLHVHHVKPYLTHPELRYEVSNGIVLCKKHHVFIHCGGTLTGFLTNSN